MVTHYPQIASTERPTSVGYANREDDGIGARVWTWFLQVYCGLHGHDRLLHFEKDRMSLRCASCGHDSPGWELTETLRPVVRARTESRRAALSPQFIRARRIA
jgi:hypothetical protein